MQQTDFTFFFDLTTSYVSFGLALYACAAIMSLGWLRATKRSTPQLVMRDLSRICGCVVCLVLLEAVRQVWDSFFYEHFPLWITRMVLPVLYLVLGNSIFRMTGLGTGSASQNEDDEEHKNGDSEAKAASVCPKV